MSKPTTVSATTGKVTLPSHSKSLIDITGYDIALVIVIKVVPVLVLVALHVIVVVIVIAHSHQTPGN